MALQTNLFQEYQQMRDNTHSDVVVEMTQIDELVSILNELDKSNTDISNKFPELSRLCTKMQRNLFGDISSDQKILDEKAGIIKHDIDKMFQIGRTVKDQNDKRVESSKKTIIKSMLRSIVPKMQKTLVDYKNIMEKHATTLNDRNSSISNENRKGSETFNINQDFLMQEAIDQEHINDNVRQTVEELKKINENIRELGAMFDKMALLVVEQEEILDNIEANIDSTNVNITRGQTELKHAETWQKRGKCCCYIGIGIFIAIVIIAMITILSLTN
jgi:hypothetical protein